MAGPRVLVRLCRARAPFSSRFALACLSFPPFCFSSVVRCFFVSLAPLVSVVSFVSHVSFVSLVALASFVSLVSRLSFRAALGLESLVSRLSKRATTNRLSRLASFPLIHIAYLCSFFIASHGVPRQRAPTRPTPTTLTSAGKTSRRVRENKELLYNGCFGWVGLNLKRRRSFGEKARSLV